MVNLRIFSLALLLIVSGSAVGSLKINLEATDALLYSNNTIVLTFVGQGGRAPYTFSYLGIPLDWNTYGDSLHISGFSPNTNRAWSFDILVRDASNLSLLQTIKLLVNGYQIQLQPVTVGVTASSTNNLPRTSNLN